MVMIPFSAIDSYCSYTQFILVGAISFSSLPSSSRDIEEERIQFNILVPNVFLHQAVWITLHALGIVSILTNSVCCAYSFVGCNIIPSRLIFRWVNDCGAYVLQNNFIKSVHVSSAIHIDAAVEISFGHGFSWVQ